MTLRGLVSALLLGLLLPQTVRSEKNCAQPNARVNIAPVAYKDRVVQSEVIISSDTKPPYATTTITRPAGTITTTRTESKTVTEFFLDAGCVVSSGSAIYTLSASATVTQDGTAPVSFWDPLKKPLGTKTIEQFPPLPKQTGIPGSGVDPNRFRDYDDRPVPKHP